VTGLPYDTNTTGSETFRKLHYYCIWDIGELYGIEDQLKTNVLSFNQKPAPAIKDMKLSARRARKSRRPSLKTVYLTAFVLAWSCAHSATAQTVDARSLDGKVLLGYQGWFNCDGDGAPQNDWATPNKWMTWFRNGLAPGTQTVDMYPDLKEFDPSDLCAVPGLTAGGKQAYLYSAWNAKVVNRHFLWMKEYGLDGVLVQRFVSRIAARRASGDVVLKNIVAAAREHGRAFAIEYDVSGANPETLLETMSEDWKYLVRELKITAQPGYLHHKGKPVLSVWGVGCLDRHPPADPIAAGQLVSWFKSGAPKECRVTYMGGVPARWRTLTGDSRTDPGWHKVYAMMDVLQPWTVGRYGSEQGANRWKEEPVVPDIARTKEQGQLYMPVVFPGFSWANLNGAKKGAKPNQIPRNGGRFLWTQAVNARQAGAGLLKIAMFDEVNEGTAVFKMAATRKDAPDQGYWLTLDADGKELPSDWYLRLSGEITRMFHGKAKPTSEMPRKPGPPWKE
jgi:hypothetical protein